MTTLTYNAAGQLQTVRDPLGDEVQRGYELGDLVSITDPVGAVTRRWVDSEGRVLSVTDALGRRIRYEYDALNQVTRVRDALGGARVFTYDANGNLLTVTDPRGGVTSYSYNSMDRPVSRTDPLLQQESYQYDGNGNLTRVTDRKGQITAFSYDALNRRLQATYADGASTTYTWDGGNRLWGVADTVSGTISLTYDNLDRLTVEQTEQGTVSYTCDAAGRRTGMTVAGQPAVTYGYDNADRLTTITQGTANVTVAYDTADRPTSLTLPNNIVLAYSYDRASQLMGITYRLGSSQLGDLPYTYDANRNRTSVGGFFARTGVPATLSSATYNANNQLTAWGGTTLTYDNNGNLLSDGTNTYTWNARNQLTSISGGTTASFQYDGLGRRTRKVVSGATTDLLYDGVNPVQELSGGTPTANLLLGLCIDAYLGRTDSAGTRYLLTDGLGSTIALTDSTGALLTRYTYEPFGKTTTSGPANSNPYQYTGRESDGTGLYYYRARYYHPTFQRFISEDPIGFAGGDVNLYAYVWNSPTNYTDPSGEGLPMLLARVCLKGAAWEVGMGVLTGWKPPLGSLASLISGI